MIVLTEHLFENLRVFYSFKVEHVLSFAIIEEKHVLSLQE